MGRRKPAYATFTNRLHNNEHNKTKQPNQKEKEETTTDGANNIMHYMSFSTSNNVSTEYNINDNPLYDLLQ